MEAVSRETTLPKELSPFMDHLAQSGPLQRWLSSYRTPPPGHLSPLQTVHDTLLSFLLITLWNHLHKPLLCFTDSRHTSDILYQHLSTLLPGQAGRISHDPPIDSTQTSHTAPLHDEQALNLFLSNEFRFFITPAPLLDCIVPPAGSSFPLQLRLQKGAPVSLETFQQTLSSWGYERVTTVSIPSTFAVRGGIVDVFPLGFPSPVRVELAGNNVESLRRFDPISQRMTPQPLPDTLSLSPPWRIMPGPSHCPSSRPFPPPAVLPLWTVPSGPPHTVNLLPHPPEESTSDDPTDLRCMSRGPFYDNLPTLHALVRQLKEKQGVTGFLFYAAHHSQTAESDSSFHAFRKIPSPIEPSFSSQPLGLFCLPLSHVYRVPKPVRPPAEPADDHPPPGTAAPFGGDFIWDGPVVHEDFGIGLYRGLTTAGTPGAKHECVSIAYEGGDLVHVPFHRLGRVHPYVGSSNKTPPLSSLSSTKWRRSKQQTRRSAEKVVDEFIHLYALRRKSTGFSFSQDAELHDQLKQSFPYTETRDQNEAYENVREDMEAERPMDRLICGDVGFGKTEVAIRAALKAACDSKQVAVLTPTTILANQHYITFAARLDPLGVRVAFLSRFTSSSRARKIVRHLAHGLVDVVVGTHRLLSPDIQFSNLGLVIVDEEHRFGARQKEKLKTVRTDVDVLTMSATPIPRTLQFSLLGIRDVSNIMTPPKERLPIITRLIPFNHDTIRRGVMAEIQRGGQLFFVNDSVKALDTLRSQLELLFPSLKMGVAHGQLPGRQLEKTMLDFLCRDLDLLVCTTIIEAGIDLPNVNTIFVNNAHRFGLSQIHQMRGRVGRSDKQGFCYLLTPPDRKLTAVALDRLKTIEYHSSLGSGYPLALKDLEMRGAGNLFGVEQSGHISSVGFHLFCKIVEEAANRRLRKEATEPITRTVDVSFSGTAMIPTSYVSEVGDRLHFYRRLSTAESREDLTDVARELKDRYGPLPPAARNLLAVAALQLEAKESAMTKVAVSDKAIRVRMAPGKERKGLLSYAENVRTRFDRFGCHFRFSDDPDGGIEFTISKDFHNPDRALKAAQYLFESGCDYSNFD